MAKIRLTLSCWEYDRTRALQEGTVQVEGVDLTYLPLHVEETFWRMRPTRKNEMVYWRG